jgi:hypothetical protein
MSKTLGGTLFIRNGIKYDYCFIEALRCLQEFCDKVVVYEVGSDDNTNMAIRAYLDGKTTIIHRPNSWWQQLDEEYGKEKLSICTNHAIEELDTDYVFNLQGDEIVDPKSYSWIRKAVDEGAEGYLCKRINLWKDPYHQLNVPHHRKPCSTEILRLAKTCYRAYDDAESIAAPCESKYVDLIKIWHMGFVRKREIHPAKIREMQGNIFKCGVDAKLDGMEVFDSTKWFTDEDLIPIEDELPPLIQQWAKGRE